MVAVGVTRNAPGVAVKYSSARLDLPEAAGPVRSAEAAGRGVNGERNSAEVGAAGESVVREFLGRSFKLPL